MIIHVGFCSYHHHHPFHKDLIKENRERENVMSSTYMCVYLYSFLERERERISFLFHFLILLKKNGS